MSLPALTNGQIQANKPLSETVMKGLRNRDAWNREDATTGGGGLAPSIAAFEAGLLAHGHTGAGNDGDPVPTAGIADGAVFVPEMIQTDSIDALKVAGNTMDTRNLQDGAVTSAKLDGTTSDAASGTVYYNLDPEIEPPVSAGMDFLGEWVIVANPLGSYLGVIGTIGTTDVDTTGEFHIRGFCNAAGAVGAGTTHIKLGMNAQLVSARYGSYGYWNYAFRVTGRG